MIRTLWVVLVGSITTVVLSIHIVLAEWFGWKRTLARICWTHPRWWASSILWAAGAKVEFVGLDRLSGEGTKVVVANHESWFDVLALAGKLPVEYRFVAKKELEKVPFWGRAWQACGHISVDRHNRQAAVGALERTRESTATGGVALILFPEGTRSSDGHMLPFKKGAFVLAIQLGAPVIPAVVLGSRHVMRKNGWRIRAGRVRIVFGEPIPVAQFGYGDRDELARLSRAAVIELRGGEGPKEPDAAARPAALRSGRTRS